MDKQAAQVEKATIAVEVAYATPDKQVIIPLQVPLGTSAYAAAVLSKISAQFTSINLEQDTMGIFSLPLNGKGQPLPKDYMLEEGDRVEIYRPLLIDPMQARQARAKKKL